MKPLAITLGDPNGVGPEILARSFKDIPPARPAVVYGDEEIVRLACERFAGNTPVNPVESPDRAEPGVLNLISPGLFGGAQLRPGELSAEAGRASLEYVRRAGEDAARGLTSGIVTLPVNKEAVRLSSPDFTGHTGFIASLLKGEVYGMFLAGERLCVSHVSTHCSLLEAIQRVKQERIEAIIRLTWETLSALGRDSGELAVAGLNPHAGEGGAFGREEIEQIAPAVEAARAEGIPAVGPIAPDTVFHSALKGRYCGVVCMYHDQGHIPMKTVDFEGGVNITMGLSVVRSSVDHGTAFDIAWKGIAACESFLKAVDYAEALIRSREE